MNVRVRYMDNGYKSSTIVTEATSEEHAVELLCGSLDPMYHEDVEILSTEIID